MAEALMIGNPPIPVSLRVSGRARRLSLRVSGLDGKVSLTLPKGASRREAQAFLAEKEGWIRSHLANAVASHDVGLGMQIPVEGHPRLIIEGPGASLRLTDDALIVPKGKSDPARRVQAFLKTRARDRLAEASGQFASALGQSFGKITLRDTRSRWGSCTSEGNLMYSWRLILAPAEVLDYVAAHEVAHLQEMNHSRAFWSLVGQICPGYEAPRKWLKQNGTRLHAYRF